MAYKIPAPQPTSLNAPSAGANPQVGIYIGDAADNISILPGAAGVGSPYVQIGQADTVNKAGVRIAASRVVLANKPTAAVDFTGSITATVTQILEAGLFSCTASATLTLPTAQGATGLVQALPNAQVGDVIEILLTPTGATVVCTLAAGTGSTLVGVAASIAGVSRIWRGRITSVAAGAETISWY